MANKNINDILKNFLQLTMKRNILSQFYGETRKSILVI